jgi:hypothetical protein
MYLWMYVWQEHAYTQHFNGNYEYDQFWNVKLFQIQEVNIAVDISIR